MPQQSLYLCHSHTSILSRSLGLEDWRKANPEADEGKFNYYWRTLAKEKKEVCRVLPSHLILSDTSGDFFRCTPTAPEALYVTVAPVTHHDGYLMLRFYRLRSSSPSVIVCILGWAGGL